jgi:hypothetical protein
VTATITDLTGLDEVVDRAGQFWCRDELNEHGWFPYPADEPYLTDAQLAEHGPFAPTVHVRCDPPGPTPGPLPGVCFSCGGTGEIHGPGGNGNWTGLACGCETAYCGCCGQPWPCLFTDEDDEEIQP